MTPYGKISASIWRSKRFRPLSLAAKLAYFGLHCSPQRNPTGLFRLPLIFLADEIGIDGEAARHALNDLTGAGLVFYDHSEELVMIRNWSFQNAVTNPKEALGRIRLLRESPSHLLTAAAAAEFADYVLPKCSARLPGDTWTSKDLRGDVEHGLHGLLLDMFRRSSDDFIRGFTLAEVNYRAAHFHPVWLTLVEAGVDSVDGLRWLRRLQEEVDLKGPAAEELPSLFPGDSDPSNIREQTVALLSRAARKRA